MLRSVTSGASRQASGASDTGLLCAQAFDSHLANVPFQPARTPRLLASGVWRLASLFLVCASLVSAAIFPEELGPATRAGDPTILSIPDRPLYEEYGLQATERAEYTSPTGNFTAEAWRLRDSTGAFALFQAQRPANASESDLGELAVQTPESAIVVYGNYVFHFRPRAPEKTELDLLYYQLPQLEQSSLPTLTGFLPAEGLIPNSQRYILGPVSLERYAPRIRPSTAAFSLGAEAQLGRYSSGGAELALLIFNYPTPSLARERQDEFLKLPNVLAKRTGPLLAVIAEPTDLDAAERVLARVEYQANITWNEGAEPKNEAAGWGRLIVSAFVLAGVLGAASILAGLGLGGLRALFRKLGWSSGPETVTVLRIHDK